MERSHPSRPARITPSSSWTIMLLIDVCSQLCSASGGSGQWLLRGYKKRSTYYNKHRMPGLPLRWYSWIRRYQPRIVYGLPSTLTPLLPLQGLSS